MRRAAAFLSLRPDFLYKLAAARRLPSVRIGRRLLFDVLDLEAWIKRHRVKPAPADNSCPDPTPDATMPSMPLAPACEEGA
ncbi:MAG: helix-turn-helix domain-containing protein [Planctomycetes bacterium]|nr:helix-turn-helix domain-containing protein [Planctomycetota bacterium]